MRILIAPNFSLPYDQRMVQGLASGFQELGHEAVALGSSISAEPLAGIVEYVSANPTPIRNERNGWSIF